MGQSPFAGYKQLHHQIARKQQQQQQQQQQGQRQKQQSERGRARDGKDSKCKQRRCGSFADNKNDETAEAVPLWKFDSSIEPSPRSKDDGNKLCTHLDDRSPRTPQPKSLSPSPDNTSTTTITTTVTVAPAEPSKSSPPSPYPSNIDAAKVPLARENDDMGAIVATTLCGGLDGTALDQLCAEVIVPEDCGYKRGCVRRCGNVELVESICRTAAESMVALIPERSVSPVGETGRTGQQKKQQQKQCFAPLTSRAHCCRSQVASVADSADAATVDRKNIVKLSSSGLTRERLTILCRELTDYRVVNKRSFDDCCGVPAVAVVTDYEKKFSDGDDDDDDDDDDSGAGKDVLIGPRVERRPAGGGVDLSHHRDRKNPGVGAAHTMSRRVSTEVLVTLSSSAVSRIKAAEAATASISPSMSFCLDVPKSEFRAKSSRGPCRSTLCNGRCSVGDGRCCCCCCCCCCSSRGDINDGIDDCEMCQDEPVSGDKAALCRLSMVSATRRRLLPPRPQDSFRTGAGETRELYERRLTPTESRRGSVLGHSNGCTGDGDGLGLGLANGCNGDGDGDGEGASDCRHQKCSRTFDDGYIETASRSQLSRSASNRFYSIPPPHLSAIVLKTAYAPGQRRIDRDYTAARSSSSSPPPSSSRSKTASEMLQCVSYKRAAELVASEILAHEDSIFERAPEFDCYGRRKVRRHRRVGGETTAGGGTALGIVGTVIEYQ